MYEVWNERLVTQDGVTQKHPAVEGYRADVWGDGHLAVRLLGEDMLTVRADTADPVGVKLSDLRAALDDLERVSPFYERSSADGEISERAAAAVERACESLDGGLATELRASVLQLIERATRPTPTATLPGESA